MKSYSHASSIRQLCYETIPQRLFRYALEDPEKVAFVYYDNKMQRTQITRRELYEGTEAFAKFLVGKGIKKGDRIALCVSNCVEWMTYDSGIMLAGGCSVRLWAGQADFLPMLEDCVAAIFDSDPTFYNKLLKVADISENGKVASETFPNLRLAINVSEIKSLRTTNCQNINLPHMEAEDVTIIVKTSGSTGKPKRVTHSSFDIINCASCYCEKAGITQNDAVFNERYFGYGGSYPLSFVATGCKYVSADMCSLNCPKDFQKLKNLLTKESCNISSMIPADLRLCTGDKPILDLVMLAGDIPSYDAMKQGLFWTKTIDNFLTTAETLMIAVRRFSKDNIGEYYPGLIGPLLPNVEAKIVDDHNNIVDIGKDGYLCVRSRWCTKVSADGKPVLDDGWFKTRDICKMTEDKEIIMLGRDVDFILKSARKVPIKFVENHVQRHPDIDGVVVVPVPDEEHEFKVCACVIMKSGKRFDEKSILKFCNEYMPPPSFFDYVTSTPDCFIQFDRFPKLGNGKVDRLSIKDLAINRLT
ncbi:acyl-CoA synthetase [Octopus vulgaris]|uniref:Acyl-CoA synthetase n=1 Tax=Octopus vulgaris TaxID=6645 RepID=A0AA36AWC3_OCTVU|nr:acyl-CoA synthetase [Octopus vulgaris]